MDICIDGDKRLVIANAPISPMGEIGALATKEDYILIIS